MNNGNRMCLDVLILGRRSFFCYINEGLAAGLGKAAIIGLLRFAASHVLTLLNYGIPA
jgi:hypothetical protein